MRQNLLKKLLLLLALATLPVFVVIFWRALDTEPTLPTLTAKAEKAGDAMLADLRSLPAKEIKEEKDSYTIEEDHKDGIDISFANNLEARPLSEADGEEKQKTTLSLPKDYGKPIEVRLDEQRIVLITDLNGSEDYEAGILTDESPSSRGSEATAAIQDGFFGKILKSMDPRVPPKADRQAEDDRASLSGLASKYLAYTSPDDRKTHLYAYQKDQSTGEKKLKSWTLYNYGLGKETESYKIDNAKIKIDDDGNAKVFFFGQSDVQSEQAKADVDPNLMDRAQRFLRQETGQDIMNDQNAIPDFTIPKPTYFTKDGVEHEAEWRVILNDSEGSRDSSASLGMTGAVILSVSFTENPQDYPIALDPTLAFTAPGSVAGGSAITGEGGSFGSAMATGDFNADGRMDLAVGAKDYSSKGKAYIFYGDGSFSLTAKDADVSLTGETSSDYFGLALAAGDFNQDGKTDLVVGSNNYMSGTGRAYIFYNDGSYPTLAVNADIKITGTAAGDYFGSYFAAGDVNADGKEDLVVGATSYSTQTGRVHIFYGGSIVTEISSGADIIITGESTNGFFGSPLNIADLNADGKKDLAVGAHQYDVTGNEGRAYVFWNDGSFGTVSCTTDCLASNADARITGEANGDLFAIAIATADFNQDGKTDLAIGGREYSTGNGRAYVFYNGSIITENASGADVIITGGVNYDRLGYSLVAADFNADGRTDLAVGGSDAASSDTYHTYIFYNDGSYPASSSSADVIITGETTNTYFGSTLAIGDMNADGKPDLIVGASGYATNTGKVYLFYSQNGQVNTNKSIVGETTSNYFGRFFTMGDFNADGKIDLAVGAYGYSTNTGRVYVFWNDGSIPTTAASADVIITGEAASDLFGRSLVSGDFNQDGETDLAVGARGYSSSAGRTYIFYNDGSYPTAAASADVIITGEASSTFGYPIAASDVNADGKTDLVAGATTYSSSQGRAYVFYNDGSIPTTAATADVIITGETGSSFGMAFGFADLNDDGKADLAVGGGTYASNTGRMYIFYADGSIPTTAATADGMITGESTSSYFGDGYIATGDFNSDGRADILIGASGYSINTGRAYVFHNDGSLPTAASSADVIYTGEATSNNLAAVVAAGDLNMDGRTDIILAANGYSSQKGRVYVLYNDGSYPASLASADLTITGDTANDSLSRDIGVGDLSGDGRPDLIVGAFGHTSNTGGIYLYETRENFSWELEPVSGLRTSPSFAGQEMKITGESGTTGQFGNAFATGDFNADGKADLAVGASAYNSNTGRVYLFYNDGSISSGAPSADVIVTGEAANNNFGSALASGDFNADGKTDLVVAAYYWNNSETGRVYIFYGGGAYPTNASAANAKIQGEATFTRFGDSLSGGDLNADGKTDLIIGSSRYNSYAGRVYVFYNDGSYPTTAGSADTIIDGETSSSMGDSIAIGDLNADGKADLIVGGIIYNGNAGRVWIFYNDGAYPTTAGSADVIISNSGFSYFGSTLAIGDFNADGKTDFSAGVPYYSSTQGRIYIFYADGTNNFGTATCSGTAPTVCGATNADIVISGENSSYFGISVSSADFNDDGRTDLAVGARTITTNTGRAYIFYNDGSIPTTAATADLILQGEATNNYYGAALTAGDFNADGKTDLIVGAYGYLSNKGRAYMYTFNDGVITGEATNNYFGSALASGDFNADGRMDLAVGVTNYRVYIFYNDGSYPSAAASADVIIAASSVNFFGFSLTAGDLNADGRTDLVVSASNWDSASAGYVYLFYNDGSYPTVSASADVIITKESYVHYFGNDLAVGDFNSDGRTDLAVGAVSAGGSTGGGIYIFYNDGSIPTDATSADVKIYGESSYGYFGASLAPGDFNSDGRIDLAVGANGYDVGSGTDDGRAYIFYNDGSYTSAAASADIILTGESGSLFGGSLISGDFNADGKTDLVVGASSYASNTGRAYIFQNGAIITEPATGADIIITGEATNNYFGSTFASGDFNADGRTDLVSGASGASKTYTFHNDGSIPNVAASADNIVTGADSFGTTLVAGDFSQDGKTDIAIGAYGYSTNTGRVYVTITEARAAPTDQALKIKGGFKTKGGFRVR